MSKEKDEHVIPPNIKFFLEYYRKNAEEDYIKTPISVLKYITYFETVLSKLESRDKDE